MIEYKDWALEQLSYTHDHSPEDWVGMSVAEMADRASAICAQARDTRYGTAIAFQSLEAMVKAMKDKYPRRD